MRSKGRASNLGHRSSIVSFRGINRKELQLVSEFFAGFDEDGNSGVAAAGQLNWADHDGRAAAGIME